MVVSSWRILISGFVAAIFLIGAAVAQTSPLYVNREYRFAIIFPGAPATRDIPYSTRDGEAVTARQFFIEHDAGRYVLTVVPFPMGRSADRRTVEHAASGLRQRGEVRFQASAGYDPGIPGRQLNIFEPNGRQLRASVYMHDRRLYITEASAAPGDAAALQFEQSITLLDAEGNDVDRGFFSGIFGFIGRVLGG